MTHDVEIRQLRLVGVNAQSSCATRLKHLNISIGWQQQAGGKENGTRTSQAAYARSLLEDIKRVGEVLRGVGLLHGSLPGRSGAGGRRRWWARSG